ncbi:MAG: phage baseplate assembly protein V [Hungatella sp.]|jgi:uncharacterized protein involved in type VI secretion and phage assembly|nr:phage baseplate assembly protein V [Hungatella sp.]
MGIFDDLLETADTKNLPFSNPGIAVGTIKENWNKDFPGKVRVELLLGEEGKNVTGWIPVAMPYCGNDYGYYSLPEIGCEVVVAFHMGDRNCPVVIGSLWNNKNKLPADTAVEKNTVKRFKTKGGCEVVFHDEDKKTGISVKTPGEFQIVIDDEKKQIVIQDGKGKNGITIDSEKGELTLAAKNKIHLSAGGQDLILADGQSKTVQVKSSNIKVEADQALNLKGQNTALEGTMINLKSQASFKVESSAMLEVKGAMVKIN